MQKASALCRLVKLNCMVVVVHGGGLIDTSINWHTFSMRNNSIVGL